MENPMEDRDHIGLAFVTEAGFTHIRTLCTPPATRKLSLHNKLPYLSVKSLNPLSPSDLHYLPPKYIIPKFYHILACHFSFTSHKSNSNNFAYFEIHIKWMKYRYSLVPCFFFLANT